MLPRDFRCYRVDREPDGRISGRIDRRSIDELPAGEVTVRVAYSALNYKDALAATGHPGVNKVFPHVPGVDAAGVVAQSGVYEFVPGDRVLVTGFDMGSNRWGGWAEYVRVPQDWLVPLPEGLTLYEAMILGTAGLTAGLCVAALERCDVRPDGGPVVVTGSSGGVGSMAVAILARLGYSVAAVTGKPTAGDYLRSLGAVEILDRAAVDDRSGRPLLSAHWAGGVDATGGNLLATILRATRHGGCIAACGLTAGAELNLTVYPFILRGVTLAGIDAAWPPVDLRHEIWRRLAGPWKPPLLAQMAETATLDDLPERIERILGGRMRGRLVIPIAPEADR